MNDVYLIGMWLLGLGVMLSTLIIFFGRLKPPVLMITATITILSMLFLAFAIDKIGKPQDLPAQKIRATPVAYTVMT